MAISRWLTLLESAMAELPDLRKKIADLSTDMKQANFKVIHFMKASFVLFEYRICSRSEHFELGLD